MLKEFFGLRVHLCEVHMFKGLMARYYQPTYERLLAEDPGRPRSCTSTRRR